MGNSGSIHNVAIGLDEIQYPHHYHQQLHLNQQDGQHDPPSPHHQQNVQHYQYPLHWTASYSSNGSSSGPQSQPHIKVLPPEPIKLSNLRPTTNGNILHSGGTLSGRRDSFNPTLLLQRSRTTLNESPRYVQRPAARSNRERIPASRSIKPPVVQSSKHSGIPGNHSSTNAVQSSTTKRFGSEPDLRVNLDAENERNSLGVNNSTSAYLPPQSKSKIVKTKKKMAPHAPINNDVNIPAPDPNGSQPQRKLRLFKTKAESRKTAAERTTPNSSMVVPEAPDCQLRRFGSPERISSSSRQYLPGRTDQGSKKQPDNKAKYIVPPVFRREKSFDITLLRNRNNENKQSENTIKASPPVLPDKSPVFRQRSIDNSDAMKNARMSTFDPKLSRLRKYSQPSAVLPGGQDFKAKLEAITKRQSLSSIDKIDGDEAKMSSSQKPRNKPVPSKARALPKVAPQLHEKEPASFKNVEVSAHLNEQTSNAVPSKIPQLTKSFYFGMEKRQNDEYLTDMANQATENESFAKIQMEVIDQFAKSIFSTPKYQCAESESSESALSSEEGCHIIHGAGIDNLSYDDENNLTQIQAHIRPTLPRRQLEIPRFSPAAAWRTLNEDRPFFATQSTNPGLPVDPVQPAQSTQPLEERIQRNYREPNPIYPDNKSGDSGISGDAGLPERVDSPRNQRLVSAKVGPFLTAWTPQQDLDEDEEEDNTSSDGETKLREVGPANKYPSRGHTFSLSLPRENQLSLYEEKEKPGFSSLQKLKRTVSGVFSSPSNNSNNNSDNRLNTNYRNDNWLLSRSAPNSIDNPEIVASNRTNQFNSGSGQETTKHPSSALSYLTTGKHVMYLPNQPIEEPETDFTNRNAIAAVSPAALCLNTSTSSPLKDDVENDWVNASEERQLKENSNNAGRHFENLTTADSPTIDSAKVTNNRKSRNSHRFTFQSTVRQIERRRIADKLSKEAEQKEAQRISELEAMRRVEEEFQRKRAGEKASIRHQLHLFSLEESQCVSLPVDWQNHTNNNSYSSSSPEQTTPHSHHSNHTQQQRAEPDGAVSSSPASSPILRSYSKVRINPATTSYGVDTSNPTGAKTGSSQYTRKDDASKFHKVNARMRQQQQTEILSEFRMPRREYFEYRSPSTNFRKTDHQQQQQTEHHEVVCKVPMSASQQQGNDQYFYNDDQNGNIDHHPRHYLTPNSPYSAQKKPFRSQSPPL